MYVNHQSEDICLTVRIYVLSNVNRKKEKGKKKQENNREMPMEKYHTNNFHTKSSNKI